MANKLAKKLKLTVQKARLIIYTEPICASTWGIAEEIETHELKGAEILSGT